MDQSAATSVEVDPNTIAFHIKCTGCEDKIYIPKHLLDFQTATIASSCPPNNLQHAKDVLFIAISDAMVREGSRMIETILHGAAYHIPLLLQICPPDEAQQGENTQQHGRAQVQNRSGVGSYIIDQKRQGAITSIAICSETTLQAGNWCLEIVGHLADDSESALRILNADSVKLRASNILSNAASLWTRPYFFSDNTEAIKNRVLAHMYTCDELHKSIYDFEYCLYKDALSRNRDARSHEPSSEGSAKPRRGKPLILGYPGDGYLLGPRRGVLH